MRSSILNILVVHNAYQIPGGEDSVVENEVTMLREAGHHVVTYFRSNSEIITYSFSQKLLLPFRSIYSKKSYKDLCQLIKSEHIDIVHVHNTLSVISPSVYYAALKCRVPVIQTIHNYRLLCPNALLHRNGHTCTDCLTHGLFESIKHNCYRNSKLQTFIVCLLLSYHRHRNIYHKISYICLTQFNKQMLLQLNSLSAKQKEIICPESVYIKPNFTTAPVNIQPYNSRSQRFLFAGRMDVSKGIWVLLKAWECYEKTLEKNCSTTKELYLCGSGPEENKIKDFIFEKHLTHVHFLGQISHNNLMELLTDSLAICMPTLWYEGFPMTIVESYACGTPVIGSDIGNVGELIIHNQTGYKFAVGDIQALTNIFLHWDTEYAQSASGISQNVRKIYEQNYTPAINLQQLLTIYNEVLEHENWNYSTQPE